MTSWAAIDPGGKVPMLAIGCDRAEYLLAEQIPGCNFSKQDQIWRAPLSWAAWVCFQTLWGSTPVTLSTELAAFGIKGWASVQDRYAARSALDASPGLGAAMLELDSPDAALLPFQRGGVEWLHRFPRTILEDPQGNGKTPQVIRAMQLRMGEFLAHDDADGPWRALVVANGAACRNWQREFSRWAPEIVTQLVTGTATARRKALEASADVLIMPWPDVRLHTRLSSYPGMAFTRCDEHGGATGKTVAQCEVHPKELNGIEFDLIVADEAHRMKDAKSKQARAVWWLAHNAPAFWAVTGTPVADSVEDAWPVLHAINPLEFPSKSRYLDLFARKEFAWGGGMAVLGLRPDTEQAFHAIVQPHVRRIPKEVGRAQLGQVYKGRLPASFRYPEMAPSQRRVYEQMRKAALAELESTTVVPENTIVKFTRMCQMAAASIETWDDEDRHGFTVQRVRLASPSHKAHDLVEFLADEDPAQQVVVYANSPQLIAICEDALDKAKISHVKVAGGMAEFEQDAAVQEFTSGAARVCFITRAGSESLNLQVSDTILFLQPNPSFLQTDQAIGRVDRIGQVNPVRVIYSITPGTVEERLFRLSQEKSERADEITRDADLMRWMLTTEA